MKPQDILFILILTILIWKRKSKYFTLAGLFFLILSIPFFNFWIFFTAERLVLYAFTLLLIATTIMIKSD